MNRLPSGALRRPFSLLQACTFAALLAAAAPAAAQHTLRWATQAGISSLDPAAAGDFATRNLLLNVYEGLVRQDRQLKIEPELATAWETVSPTVTRFKLRPGVVFHDGDAFTAADVEFSFKRATSPTADIRGKLRSIKEIRATGPLVVEVETHRPNPTLLNELTVLPIMSRAWATRHGATDPADNRRSGTENHATRRANGTGPFRVVSYETDVKVELARHDKWWDKREHNLDGAVLLPIKAHATRLAALLSGQVDLIAPLATPDEQRVKGSPGHQVVRVDEARVVYLGFDHARDVLLNSSVKDRNPFKDRRVRQAMALAVDTALLQRVVMRGASTPVDALIPSVVNGWDPSFARRPPASVEQARQLLKEAGYADGFSVTLDCPNEGIVNAEQLCVAVVGMLGKAGIKVDLVAQPRNLHAGKLGRRETSFFLHSWGTNTFDAHATMDMLMSTPAPGVGTWNVGAYSNPALDELLKASAAELDSAKRSRQLTQALQMLRDDAAVIPLHQPVLLYGVSKKVQFTPRADDAIQLRWVTLK